ncbi:GNAT family N-acetyltransferase [Clostridium tertium]|nr:MULTISPECIES: GNAT family N-acetyltransferase [Clostridium]MBS5306945.1 GNAT family N-acetyltransferase [Clostridium sp.]MDB1922149.1 GNAT family N-acetyltransferase [Clostridium tertium]MDB1927519.1 GNAT family N-acetyltransferase [Clostridium tertium]MDB1930874.1 GNAT family N-acetyltransferase [Clostridium tertium]MDB1944845.1 GNAT family N-acetyltransferase [Clostridium tertium]
MNIRKIKVEDADNLLKMLLQLDKETKFMLLEPGERSNDVSKVNLLINQCIEGRNLLLVGIDDTENIIGFLSAQRGVPKRIRHTAYIVVGIREAFRGIGIGKKLFSELDIWAKENDITRLELTVVCRNNVAKHLYEQNGFKVEGIKKNSMIVDGKYVDEYYMAKLY